MDQITFTEKQYRNLRHTLHNVFNISSGIFPELAAFGNYRNDRSDAIEHEFSNLLFLLSNVRPPSAKRPTGEASMKLRRKITAHAEKVNAGNQTGEFGRAA